MRTTSHRDKFDQHYGSTIVIALLVIFVFTMTKFILYATYNEEYSKQTAEDRRAAYVESIQEYKHDKFVKERSERRQVPNGGKAIPGKPLPFSVVPSVFK